ncbi:MAG: sensor histidine kinase [Enterococcus sp.]
MKKKASLKQSSRYQLGLRFSVLLSLAIMLVSASIVLVLVRQSYESTEQQADYLSSTIEQADTATQAEWLDFLATYTYGETSPYLVRVVLPTDEVIYSHGARALFDDFSNMQQLFFLDHVLWTDTGQLFYYTSLQKDGATVGIFVDMNSQVALLKRVILLSLLLTLVFVALGVVFTYRFADLFTRPLSKMHQEIASLHEEFGELSVPKTPYEVQYVAEAFNELMKEQQQVLQREKRLVSDVSHELRTPLTAIRGHVDLIKRRGEQHPEVIPKSLGFIDSESKRMSVMVEQLLVLGRRKVSNEEFNLSKVLHETLAELAVMMPQKLAVKIQQGIVVTGNPEHFRQIIRNLLENAAKYTPSDGQIAVKLLKEDQAIIFEVLDTGIGIPDEAKAHIFERFYRVDQSRSSEVTGSGIGLAIVKELLELYEGSIQVDDNVPSGSRFKVILKNKKE